jgi:hypothetical protein
MSDSIKSKFHEGRAVCILFITLSPANYLFIKWINLYKLMKDSVVYACLQKFLFLYTLTSQAKKSSSLFNILKKLVTLLEIYKDANNSWNCQRPLLFFFCGTGVWTQDLTLARQALYPLSHDSSVFALVIFWIVTCIFTQAGLEHNLPIYASCIAGMTSVNHQYPTCWLR